MKTRNIILAANIALLAGDLGLLSFGKWKEHKAYTKREEQVSQLVERFKACPDSFRSSRECFTKEEIRDKLSQATDFKKSGNFLEAGKIFASLGPNYENDAREMAGRCDDRGRKEILDILSMRLEAAISTGL